MNSDMNINKLKKILKAASNTQYYSKIFKDRNIDIDQINNYEDFKQIPITTKKDYKKNTLEFISNSIADKMNKEYLKSIEGNYKLIDEYLEKFGLNLVITSGSTGIPLEVIHSYKDDIRNYFALNMYRRKISDFRVDSKYMWILPMNEKTKSIFYAKSTKYILDKNGGVQYFLVNYKEENLKDMHEVVIKNKIQWITGSPSAVSEYARYLRKNDLHYVFDYIELHSEPCLDWQRELIEDVFKISPNLVYSSNEINFIAGTCDNGSYHILEDNVFVEFIDKRYGEKDSKKILITGLNYLDTPLLRYDIGDIAETVECHKCEFSDKAAIKLKGFRDSDMIKCKNGDLLEPYIIYDSVFFLEKRLNFTIGYYQVEQVAYKKFVFKFEELSNWKEETRKIAKRFLQEFMMNALGFKVSISLIECERHEGYNNNAEAKYKRFKSLCKMKEEEELEECIIVGGFRNIPTHYFISGSKYK